MPVKRRHDKRRIDPAAEAEIWDAVFDCGTDFFGELAELGVETDCYGGPDRDAAREAWQRLGPAYLDTHSDRDSRGNRIWALQHFGEPSHAH